MQIKLNDSISGHETTTKQCKQNYTLPLLFHRHDILEGGRMFKEEIIERVIFVISLKLYEWILKNLK